MRGEARGRPVLAIDLGGTTTRVALVGPGGRLLARTAHPTAAEAEPEATLKAIAAAGDALLVSARLMPADLRGVGMAVPGPMDSRRGVVLTSPNLPRWRDVPLCAMLEARWPAPAFAENDANAAALGERYYGAGKNFTDFIYLTISTGIGGGLVLGGRLYRGGWGAAGEVGHMVIDPQGPPCGCGQRGCLEALASGTALAREARRRLARGEASSLAQAAPDELSSREVFAAARAGDALSLEIVQGGARSLGLALANLISLLNPQAIILGGGLSQEQELYLEPAAALARERAFAGLGQDVAMIPSALGDDAGLLGAAALVREGLRGRR